MTDDQQPAVEAATGDNVMGKVLGMFDGLVDSATAAVGGAASAIDDAGAGLVEKGGEVTGTHGEKATGGASGVGAVLSANFEAAVTFAKGLLGGQHTAKKPAAGRAGGHFAATFRRSVTLMRATPIILLLF